MSDFREDLRPFEDITAEELQAAVAALPERIKSQLALGPLPRRYSCRICSAFGGCWYNNTVWDRTDPKCIVFCYHEVPKIEMRVAEDQWSGPQAEDVYRRCTEIYRAAGWEEDSTHV